jgi:phosphoribosyl 1,2-cyclic phosphate phosphodiesterase
MEVTFLGTGTSQGVPVIACECAVCTSEDERDKRLRVSIHIAYKGKSLVVDTGPDFRQQILRAGIKDLDAVLMTHEHKDHTAGMDDVRAFNFKYQKDMPVYAVPRVQQSLRREFYYVFEKDPYPGVPRLQLETIGTAPFDVEGISVTPIEVMHYKLPVLGFRIADMAYITDAKTIIDVEAEKLYGLDVLILNALRKEKHISHLTLDEALEWVDRFKPKRAYLTHISHLMGKHEEIQRTLPEHVHLAYDGLQIQS